MSSIITYPLRLFIFWIGTFFVFRLLFFWTNTAHDAEALQGLYMGFQLDSSVACYLISVPILLWITSLYVKHKLLERIGLGVSIVLFIVVSLIEISSIPLFKEWGSTFNNRAFTYMLNEPEAWSTMLDFSSFGIILLALLILAGGVKILSLLFKAKHHQSVSIIPKTIVVVIYLIIIPLTIRGGLGHITLSISSAFYSNNISNNFLSVNKTFYFIEDLTKQRYMDIMNSGPKDKELSETYKRLYLQENASSATQILKTKSPNIVLVVLEGCVASLFEPLGGQKEVAPQFTELSGEGLLFTNIYSSGHRTDQGLLSLLSGVPSMADLNVMFRTELTNEFPSVLKELKTSSYNTIFLYGGNANFSNMGSYFYTNQIDQLIQKSDFPMGEQTISWGVPDNLVFNRGIEEFDGQKEPFFSCILTQSSHRPFDISGGYKFTSKDTPSMYKSSVFFADSCLGKFISDSKEQDWYENTLFIVTSDHGSTHLDEIGYNDKGRYHIPLLLFGPALKDEFRGVKMPLVGSQHDFPTTLLSLLDINSSEFIFSKNLLDSTSNSFAYWSTNQAIGWVVDGQELVTNHKTGEIAVNKNPDYDNAELTINSKSYFKLVADYIFKQKKPTCID